ncbi:hypothetical protein [Acetobacter orientalis]|uniref:hypothetical protein n=1 Tax=Acetobacter orientalis TaxID=146474 RepID=UPI0039E79D12
MSKFHLNKVTARCLKEHFGEKLTARDIALWIYTNYPKECAAKQERSKNITTEAALIQQLVAEIGAHRPQLFKAYNQIRTTEDRPRLYYWTDQSEQQQVEKIESLQRDKNSLPAEPFLQLLEAHLYPRLGQFLSIDSELYTQRIDEKRSSNKRGPHGNHWLYPDLVAFEDLTRHWASSIIKNCVTEVRARRFRLWSFEVKILLNRSNVREAYFQTVSNSSWANFAYLAANEIEGPETLKELRILNALHGVGLIRIDKNDPSESEILIPARERLEIDWTNCDRLASENTDFSSVIHRVWEFHRTGSIKVDEWTC